jgi:hypothetical protein
MGCPLATTRFYWGRNIGFPLGGREFISHRRDGSDERDLINKIAFIRHCVAIDAKTLIVDQVVREYMNDPGLPLPDRIITFKDGSIRFQYTDGWVIRNVDYFGKGEKAEYVVRP